MIVGHAALLETAKAELPAVILQALHALRALDFSKLEDGAVDLGNDKLKANLFHGATTPLESKRPEAHIENIDIHYLVSGDEVICYQPMSDHPVQIEAREAQDCYFYENQVARQSSTRLTPGGFAVCFPWDLHTPLCAAGQPGDVRKVVVKVPLAAL